MGLLDMLQNDPEKREALRQGLLAAGSQMMAGGRQDLGTSIGQGLGSGVNTYASQREQYKREAEQARAKQAQMQATQAAMMPGRPAMPAQFNVGGNPYATRNAAQSAAMPNQNTQLMAGAMGSQAQPQAIEEVPGQDEQPGGFDFDRYNTAVLNDPDNPDREAALKYFASKKPDELETVVVGRTLKNKRTGETIGYDETWKEERDATREQRIAELNMRLDDQRLNREQQMELRRELAGQQAALRRDLAEQSSASRRAVVAQGNKPPSGYRYTPDGNLEQIPGGPADLKRQAQIEGGGTVDTVVADLRDMYGQLGEKGGITSTKNRWGSNLAAGLQSSDFGQAVGKKFGTDNQSLRNTVAQKRPLLLQAIMKATGMTAKQMDSNTELKLYLSTATDPTLDLETNKRALDMIEKLYGSGAGNAPIAPDGENERPTKPPANKADSYNEYLDAFKRATPAQRKAINARAREMGVIK